MRVPTEEQEKKVWGWCGFKQLPVGKWAYHWEKCIRVGNWLKPDNDNPDSSIAYLPPIDLNSLFEYASQHFISMACGNINEPEWKGAWAKVITHERETSHIWEAGLTPALALFWAIYKVLEA